MSALDDAIAQAREPSLAWDAARGSRVLASALLRREARARRERLVHRALVTLGTSTLFAVALLRWGAGGAESNGPERPRAASAYTSALAKATPLDDAGFFRD